MEKEEIKVETNGEWKSEIRYRGRLTVAIEADMNHRFWFAPLLKMPLLSRSSRKKKMISDMRSLVGDIIYLVGRIKTLKFIDIVNRVNNRMLRSGSG